MMARPCKRCGGIDKGPDGTCKTCKRAYSRRKYAENLERSRELARASSAKHYAENPARVRESAARYRAANPEKVRAVSNAWKAANQDRVIAYREANREKSRAVIAEWYVAHQERYRVYSHNRRARMAANGGALSPDLAERLLKLQRGKCACCGSSLGNAYHLAHIMPLALGGSNTDDNIQLLRAICNKQKAARHPAVHMRQRGFLL